VIGTLDDLHHGEAWHQIEADPELIKRYNALKRAHEGGSEDDYKAAKRDFFHDNFGYRTPLFPYLQGFSVT
jgi:hypothetical protein